MLEDTFLCDKTDVLNSLCLRLSDLWIHYKRHCYCVHLHEWRGWNTDEVYLCECRINPESLCFAIIIEIVLNEKNYNCHPTTSFQKLVCWIYRISPLMKHLNTIQHVSINMSEVLFVQSSLRLPSTSSDPLKNLMYLCTLFLKVCLPSVSVCIFSSWCTLAETFALIFRSVFKYPNNAKPWLNFNHPGKVILPAHE